MPEYPLTAPASRNGPAGLCVVHVVDEGAWGGLATFVSNLVLSQQADSEIGDIHLVCDPDEMDPALKALPVILHAYQSDRRLLAARNTSRAIEAHLRSIGPDIVILHSSFPGFWGRLIRRPTWKVLYCAHGWAFQQQVGAIKRALYRFAERMLSKRTHAVVSISGSEYAAGERAQIVPKIHRLILHGLPNSALAPAPLPARQTGIINLLFIGRFDRQKGLDILLEVFEDQRLDAITLSIIGRNVIGEGVVVPDRVNIRKLGWIPNDHIDAIIQSVDAVIVPSRWEGFGLVALEAMRNGRAVLSSGAGGLSEIVQDGVNGRVIDVADVESVRELLCSLTVSELERLGEEGHRLFCEKYSWDNCFAQWRGLTREIRDS